MKKILVIFLLISMIFSLCACKDSTPVTGSTADRQNTKAIANMLSNQQPTPTDIDFSLERYNLTRRVYWVKASERKPPP